MKVSLSHLPLFYLQTESYGCLQNSKIFFQSDLHSAYYLYKESTKTWLKVLKCNLFDKVYFQI